MRGSQNRLVPADEAEAFRSHLRRTVGAILAALYVSVRYILQTTITTSIFQYYLDAVAALLVSAICAGFTLHLLLWLLLLRIRRVRHIEEDFASPTWRVHGKHWLLNFALMITLVYFIVPKPQMSGTEDTSLLDGVLGVSKVILPAASISATLLLSILCTSWVTYNVLVNSEAPFQLSQFPWAPSRRLTSLEHFGLLCVDVYIIGVSYALSNLGSPLDPSVVAVAALNDVVGFSLKVFALWTLISHAVMFCAIAFDRTRRCRESNGASAIVDLESGEYMRGIEEMGLMPGMEGKEEHFEDAGMVQIPQYVLAV